MPFTKKNIYKMNKIITMPDGRRRMMITINGKRIPVYGKDDAEVERQVIKKYEASAQKKVITPQKERFDKSLLKYIKTFKVPIWSKSTYSRNILLFRTHIENKKIGKMQVGQIESDDIQILFNSIARNYSYSEIKRVKFLINPYFKYLLKKEKIDINPCEDTTLPDEENCAVKTKDMNEIILTEAEIKKLITVAQKYETIDKIVSVYYHALLILISSGMRVGELMALKWSDIDFEMAIFSIKNTTNLVSVPDLDNMISKCERIINSPKTKSGKRIVGMSKQCIYSLNYIKNYQEQHKIDNKENLVICNSNGNYLQNRDLRNVLKKISREIGINEDATIHGLRHSFGTYIYGQTKDIIGIQRVMGHADSRTTEKYYVHTQLQLIQNISNAFNITQETA